MLERLRSDLKFEVSVFASYDRHGLRLEQCVDRSMRDSLQFNYSTMNGEMFQNVVVTRGESGDHSFGFVVGSLINACLSSHNMSTYGGGT